MADLQPGDVLDGKYRILRLLGEGGMGAVYEGENIKIHRKVAIKTLLGAVAGNADVVSRFEREATAAGRIGNAHILEVLDLGEMSDGDRYMVMELLDGEPLSNRIEGRGRLTPAELAPIAIQMLEGLGAAHAAGIIHRDLKPDNVYLLRNHVGIKDYVKLIDFGISKFQTLSGEGEAMSMTRTGAVMGTPYYMSPEQASGSRETDARTDLYAVGVIMYQAVTGRVPFDAPTFNQLLFKIVLSEPEPLKSVVPDLDEAFASIISKGMARDINTRFQTSEEFKAAIEAWKASGASVSIPPPPDRASMEASAIGIQVPKGPAKGNATAGSWSTSQAGVPPAAPNNKPILAGLALSAVLLVGGGVAAVRMFSGGSAASAAASAAPPASPVPAAATPATPPATPVVTAAPAPAAPPAAPAVAPAASAEPAATAEKPAAKEPASSSKTASRPASRPAAVAPAPAPAPAAKPKPAKKAADDDFGY